VVGEAATARRRVSLPASSRRSDEELTGHENLVLLARLLGYSWQQAGARADEFMEAFGLTEAAAPAIHPKCPFSTLMRPSMPARQRYARRNAARCRASAVSGDLPDSPDVPSFHWMFDAESVSVAHGLQSDYRLLQRQARCTAGS
jgi:hypothetical protein